MGDLIYGSCLIILFLVLYGLYRLISYKKRGRSFMGFISLLIVAGGILGIFTTCFNKHSWENNPVISGLTLLFFLAQVAGAYLYSKSSKTGFPVLVCTFLLQIPIIHSSHVSFRSQTLFSFNLDNYPGKIFDLEPGSYVHFVYGIPHALSFGINIIPIIATILFIRYRPKS